MRILAFFCYLVVAALAGASEADTKKIQLANGYILNLTETSHSRIMPYAFYDQAIESIPKIHPNSKIFAARRLGRISGDTDVLYSLVGYKEAKDAREITISGIATRKDRAWSFSTKVTETSLTQTLLLVLEALSNLP